MSIIYIDIKKIPYSAIKIICIYYHQPVNSRSHYLYTNPKYRLPLLLVLKYPINNYHQFRS